MSKLRNAIVILVVFFLLGTLLLCGLQAMREAARRTSCIGQYKMFGLSMHNLHSTQGRFPPAYLTDGNGHPTLSWRTLLLPYLEQGSLYEQCRFNEPWDSPHNGAGLGPPHRHVGNLSRLPLWDRRRFQPA